MGGTLWELVKLMFFTKNLIRNRSFGERFFFKFSMISSDGFKHGLSCGNHLEPSESTVDVECGVSRSCDFSHRHGNFAPTTVADGRLQMVADGCERLRTPEAGF